jgi:ribosomal protein L37AE/L43A
MNALIYWLHVLKVRILRRWFLGLSCPECGRHTIKPHLSKQWVCDTCGWTP